MASNSGPGSITMFTGIENKVVEILKNAIPSGLVPPDRIVPGPVDDPTQVPFITFTAGDFEVFQNDEIMDIPKPDDALHFSVSALLEVWADSLEKIEEIALKAMAAILTQTPTIEAGAGGELSMGNLKLSFNHHRLRPLKGIKMQQNGNLSKGEITYGIESVMTISQLDFDFGKMEVIDAVLEAPQPVNFQTALGQEILEKDVGAMRGIGAVTRQKLVQLNIHTIRQLALADTRPLLAEVPSIDGLKQNAKAVRRITNEVLNEIVDREHPFPESFYGSFLYEIAQLSAADIQNQTGKSEENVVIFLDNLTELSQSLLKANEFAALSLADFK
jgi:hypothetical protein